MNFLKTREINAAFGKDRDHFIAAADESYYSQLKMAAQKIIADKDKKPLVLLSGPSGSGKTTSAGKIADYIREAGITVHMISMDDYFLPKTVENLPVDEDGKIDLESPYRLDIPLFTDHLRKLFRCEPIEVPVFDFSTQMRKKGQTICRDKNEIIIIEGIHALNPLVTGDSDSFTTCIYVSVRTRITSDNDTVLHPKLIRLMRRLCRDRLFRGRELPAIFDMFESVSRGEDLYIMPFKHRAAFDIDTFLAYEASVYTGILRDDLEKIESEMDGNENYESIMKLVCELYPQSKNIVPENALIREFVGENE